MVLRSIKNNMLYTSKYSIEDDEYIIYQEDIEVRRLKPALFRYLLYDREKEYVVEKDDI